MLQGEDVVLVLINTPQAFFMR